MIFRDVQYIGDVFMEIFYQIFNLFHTDKIKMLQIKKRLERLPSPAFYIYLDQILSGLVAVEHFVVVFELRVVIDEVFR
jgi:hypothetical protein